jgi:hypothetical protein
MRGNFEVYCYSRAGLNCHWFLLKEGIFGEFFLDTEECQFHGTEFLHGSMYVISAAFWPVFLANLKLWLR